MGEIIFKTELIKGAKGDRGEAGQADSIPTDGVIAFQGETVPDGYEETDPGDVFDEVYEDINAVKDMIADEYDTTATYNAGDYCTHENVLYKCTATTTGLWDGSKWVLTSAGDETKANAAAIEAIVNVNGCCNVLRPYLPVSSGGGVTLTLNADGTISCPAVTSTNPDGSFFVTGLWTATASGSFKFSGCPSGGSSNTYFHYLMEYPSGGGSPRVAAYDYGDGEEITVTSGYMYETHIVIKTAATSLLFKPMLYDARLKPSGYVPYAMTNRELTERVSDRYVSVVGDGVKTHQQLMNDLYALVDRSKLTKKSKFGFYYNSTLEWYCSLSFMSANKLQYDGITGGDATTLTAYHWELSSVLADCKRVNYTMTSSGLTVSDGSSSIPASTNEYRVYY